MGWKLGTFLKNQNYHKETMTNYFKELNKIKPFDSFTVSEKFYEARKILSLLPQAIEEAQYHESLSLITFGIALIKTIKISTKRYLKNSQNFNLYTGCLG